MNNGCSSKSEEHRNPETRVASLGFTGLVAVVLLTLGALNAGAQGTAFTYQGRLNAGSGPATGLYDFQFNVCDAATAGNVLAGPVSVSGVAVSNGLFTVTLDFGGAVFTGPARWLDISVRTNGAGTFTDLSPRQLLSAAPYAVFAGGVNAAGISGTIPAANIGNGTITGNMLASNSITAGQLAPGAALASLNGSGQSGVPSSGLVLSSTDNNAALVNAGYVKLGTIQGGDTWQQKFNGTPPAARDGHTAVWTGSEMIIWGGYAGTANNFFNDGGRFNPVLNAWVPFNQAGAPAVRGYHTAVWTGTEMIVWGGTYGGGLSGTFTYNDGGRYNPVANSWTPVATTGAPGARYLHTAAWTGSEMIIWGGDNGSIAINDGARYNPASNSWVAVNSTNAPSSREYHTAVWDGSEMLVWGGQGFDINTFTFIGVNTGARYNPASDSWSRINTNGAPAGRMSHTAVWTGTEMIAWGGNTGSALLGDGGRYNPGADSWTLILSNAPSELAPRASHTAIWTGNEMVVWGGSSNSINYADGARYNPGSNTWSTMTAAGAPAARYGHTAVWSGSEMLVWGGYGNSVLNSGGRYNVALNSWTPISAAPVLGPRIGHTAVWTGTEMIIWGGGNTSVSQTYGDGGRYNPTLNSWTAVNTSGAPSPRANHTAVWTGTEMIIWGGANNSTYYANGARYNPATDAWTPVPAVALAGRANHTAVWTGTEMIVWGGYNGTSYFSDGSRYNPAGASWLAVNTSGAPGPREYHTAVWTGNQMIIWGGYSNNAYYADGGRFTPGVGWSAIPVSIPGSSSPYARAGHSAVWTGSDMIIFGGYDNLNNYGDGWRYNPVSTTWSYTTRFGAPGQRYNHSAVWTGSEMLIWGGASNYNSAVYLVNDGKRYNPALDSWQGISAVNAPPGRENHTAVWTGTQMLIWGGYGYFLGTWFNDNWAYTPGTVMYLYQRP